VGEIPQVISPESGFLSDVNCGQVDPDVQRSREIQTGGHPAILLAPDFAIVNNFENISPPHSSHSEKWGKKRQVIL
jgi:hypothetical protein